MNDQRAATVVLLVNDDEMIIRAVRSALMAERVELDHQIITLRGEVKTCSLQCEVIITEGAQKCLRGSYQDITERKRIGGSELEVARDEVQAANAAKTAFLAALLLNAVKIQRKRNANRRDSRPDRSRAFTGERGRYRDRAVGATKTGPYRVVRKRHGGSTVIAIFSAPHEPTDCGNRDAFLTDLRVAKSQAVDRVPQHARDRQQ
jgi:hypothetical protein